MIHRLAVPSETSLERRGWVADPAELLSAQQRWERIGATLVGSYHTHRVPWASDPARDTCTALDRALSQQTGLWTLIVSMVDPAKPVVRAFFEADNDHEAEIVVGQVEGPA
jgi:proteasome lid subunit RPN8/RPN11